MSGPALSVDHVSKRFRVPLDHAHTLQYRFSHPVSTSRYRDLPALNDVSFQIERGQFVGITGPNGCGKSTLLKVLSRIYEPDSGAMSIQGRVSPFLELGVGFKYELTARDNIRLGGALLGLTRAQLDERADDVLAFAELQDFADQKLKNFSSGMVVRLAFSVAMLADADILLMDEVLAVGDARFQEKCFEVFAEYKREGRTVVLVSHDLVSLELNCDRVLLMQEGRLIADGPSADVTAEYRRIVGAMSEHEATGVVASEGLLPAQRWGTRDVEVVGVRMLDRHGRQHHTFVTGEPVTIEVDYTAHASVGSPVCGLAFKRADGITLATPNTTMSRFELPPVSPGTHGRVIYQIPALPLLAASYHLTATIYDAHLTKAFDHLEDLLEFRVMDERGRVGFVELGGGWQHTTEEIRKPAQVSAHDSRD